MDLSGATWRKASRSHDDGDQCIELASASGVVVVRDSKDPSGPKIFVSSADFRLLAEAIKGLNF
ncbi:MULTISPECIES: DUF397 domain-containing protein [Actinomadura]|uniref:DUF397 domain-containing protein n=1 Tax=Actinomadura geliboluensis TaxID=882440 RepID=A0A5S4H4J1_9ACTN|nr:DUF397 domain-containing protein [Actinomadura geliboluensis]TMR39939.1 DUF397 domain-containing protein [Actinomadura geliboluensis]